MFKDVEVIKIVGLNLSVAGLTLSDISVFLSITFTVTSFAYLIWKWRREAGKDKKKRDFHQNGQNEA